MQKFANKISFTQNIVASLYDNYTKSAFCGAIRVLIKDGLLDEEEKRIFSIITDKLKTIPDFLKKSYIIYLSNGILFEKDINKINLVKKQLIFELSLQLLSYGLKEKIEYRNEDENLFSLCLNQSINIKFDSIKKEDENYIFNDNNKEVLRLNRNIQSSITKDICFLGQDKNPFNVDNDHPDEEFVAYDLKGIPKEEWVRQFAYGIIKRKTPELYSEIYYFLDAIVPHGYEKERQLSSSYSKSPGILYLSYTDTDIKQAEALIHEVHHTIFNIIEWKYKLYNNDMSLKYYSAYRPDARHLRGCFLGLHAFVAVQNFYRKLAKNGNNLEFIKTFVSLYLKNEKVISMLEKYADFIVHGSLLFEDIKARYYSDMGFFKGLAKKYSSVYQQVLEDVEAHLEEAKNRNKILLY
jgi:hypothetical protein